MNAVERRLRPRKHRLYGVRSILYSEAERIDSAEKEDVQESMELMRDVNTQNSTNEGTLSNGLYSLLS